MYFISISFFRNRHKSPEAMRQWQHIEKELFNSNTASKVGINNDLPLEPIPTGMQNKILENDRKKQDICGDDITSCAKLEIGQSETGLYSFFRNSEMIFGVFKSPKKQTKFLKDFCPSLSNE